MKTNKDYLCLALGIKGDACLVTVSDRTGLTVQDILDLHVYPVSNPTAYGHGIKAVKLGVVDIWSGKIGTYPPDQISFWRGVLDAQKDKK